MKFDAFFEHFEKFADAPNAVERMRELVLQLAVQGRLVEQRADELPAAECIANANRPLVDPEFNGVARLGWASVQLGSVIASNVGGGTPSKRNPHYWNGDIPWASVKDVSTAKFLESTVDSITKLGLEHSSSNLIPPGHLIVVTRMGLGKLAINKISIAINQDLRAIEPTAALDLDFAYLLFKSLRLVGKGVTVKGITVKTLHGTPVNVPPLAEQKRIVAKVDELMAMCDRLEEQQRERDAQHKRIVHAATARFNDAPTPKNLNFLFHKSYQIPPAELRKAILNFAVRGRLVTQEPGSRRTGDAFPECKLESLVKIVRGSSPRPKGDPRFYGGPVPRLLIADITRDGKYVTPNFDSLTLAGAKLSRPMNRGSLVIAISGSYGVPAFLAVDACIHDGFIGFRVPSSRIDLEYLYLVLLWRRPYFDEVVKDSGLKNLTTRHLKEMLVPLPPLAEQKRIVAKVDRLMALVDQLEADLTASRALSEQLMDAVLRSATAEKVER